MKTLILSMAAVSALAVAAPAAAQYMDTNAGVTARINQLQTQIQGGVQNRTLTREEAQILREQLRQLRQLNSQYSANVFTAWERQDLQSRIQNLREHIRYAARNDDLRGNDRKSTRLNSSHANIS